jgi:PAS domain S-box-containing protein
VRKTDLPEVYDNLPVAVCIIDQERRILYANRAFSELIGVLNKNAGEERFGDTFGCIHALEDPQGCGVGDRCAECPVSLAVEDTFATGKENRDVEQRFSLERDGVRRDATVLASTTIVRIDNMDALLLCLQDITGRRNEEARCRAFYKNSAIGFYRTTPAGEIVQANPALVRMLGYDSFEQLAERNLSSEGFAPDYPRTEFAERLEREGTISGFESSWTLADGSRKWLQENAWLTRDADGRPLYYDGTVEDVTRLIETQDRYRRLYEDQQIITDIARILAGAHVENADVQFARVLETVGEYLGVDRVHIVPLSGENAPEYRIREWCASGISPWSDDNRSQVVDQCSWLMDRFDQEEPVQIPDITALPPGAASQLQTYLPHDARSLIYLPFPKNDNDLAGCLHCEVVREPREWIPR